MTDVVDAATRSRMMKGIGPANTRPELTVRKALHKAGFRFRLHCKDLPGKPDLVLPRYRSVIFVHGCFWHMHDCRYFKLPSTRRDFWTQKLGGNRERDERKQRLLEEAGWHVLVVWECEIRDGKDWLSRIITALLNHNNT